MSAQGGTYFSKYTDYYYYNGGDCNDIDECYSTSSSYPGAAISSTCVNWPARPEGCSEIPCSLLLGYCPGVEINPEGICSEKIVYASWDQGQCYGCEGNYLYDGPCVN